jgi:hypothetical protein
MSDGGIGDPKMSYCATIRISGNIDQARLQQAIDDIENILKPVNGRIENHARVSTGATFDARILPVQKP